LIGKPVRTEIFYREDIRTMLQAIDEANGALMMQLQGRHDVSEYRAGFAAAVQAVATAFDVSLEPQGPVVIHMDHQLVSGFGSE